MSIASEIQRLQSAKAGIKSALESKLSSPGIVKINQYPTLIRELDAYPTSNQVSHSYDLVIVFSFYSQTISNDESFYFEADDIKGFAIYNSLSDAENGASPIVQTEQDTIVHIDWQLLWNNIERLSSGSWVIFGADDNATYYLNGYYAAEVDFVDSDLDTFFQLDLHGRNFEAYLWLDRKYQVPGQSFYIGVDFY